MGKGPASVVLEILWVQVSHPVAATIGAGEEIPHRFIVTRIVAAVRICWIFDEHLVPVGGLTSFAEDRQQDRNQQGDDANHHQQFNQL